MLMVVSIIDDTYCSNDICFKVITVPKSRKDTDNDRKRISTLIIAYLVNVLNIQ